MIQAGEMRYSLSMRQFEECRECGKAGKDDCDCGTPDFGKSFDAHRCEECDKLLTAIEATENEAGCLGDESLPALECMIKEMRKLEAEHREKYFIKVLAMFPELARYVEWMRAKFPVDAE